jgi:hypothetical protein
MDPVRMAKNSNIDSAKNPTGFVLRLQKITKRRNSIRTFFVV